MFCSLIVPRERNKKVGMDGGGGHAAKATRHEKTAPADASRGGAITG